jgi:hypothetical protein
MFAAAGNTQADLQVNTSTADTGGVYIQGGTTSVTIGSFGAAGALPINFAPQTAGALRINGTPGVTCAGTPTASFASTLGLVTHC